jgi:hypothetical protein
MSYRNYSAAFTAVMISFLTIACTPQVQMQALDKSIFMKLNVKIEHEVRVKVEKDIDQALSNNPGLF